MNIYNEITKTDTYVQLKNGEDNIVVLPANAVIFVDDESGFVAVKTVGARKTIGLVPADVYNE